MCSCFTSKCCVFKIKFRLKEISVLLFLVISKESTGHSPCEELIKHINYLPQLVQIWLIRFWEKERGSEFFLEFKNKTRSKYHQKWEHTKQKIVGSLLVFIFVPFFSKLDGSEFNIRETQFSPLIARQRTRRLEGQLSFEQWNAQSSDY